MSEDVNGVVNGEEEQQQQMQNGNIQQVDGSVIRRIPSGAIVIKGQRDGKVSKKKVFLFLFKIKLFENFFFNL